MSKTSIRAIAVLITLATVGVVLFQISWLRNSYAISKEQLRLDVKNALDGSIAEHRRQSADTMREMMKMLIRSDKDFRYEFFNYQKTGMELGIRGPKHNTYHFFRLDGTTEQTVKKDPHRFLTDRMNEMSLDELRPLYSVLIGTREYPENSADEQIALRLAYKFERVFMDSLRLKGLLKHYLNARGIGSKMGLYHYPDITSAFRGFYRMRRASTNGSQAIIEAVPAPRMSLIQKLDDLDAYVTKMNQVKNVCYVAKPLLYPSVEDNINDNVPTLAILIKVSPGMILSKMIGNIIASVILLIVVSFCMAYMLRTIVRQKKLAEIKNDFISNISHELKTPVATALAAVQGMQYFDVLKDPTKTTNYLNTAEAEIKRLGVMVNKIINVSIFENKGFNLNPVTFNFKDLLTDMVAAQCVRQEKPISINLNYQAREELFADRVHIHNVMVNLLDNAINYSGNEVKIDIECANVGPNIRIRVSDNGIGIPAEYQKMIFDKFFRVPKAGNPKGYGLGLNYVKHIIEKHHGSIILERSGTDGSTFMISLPG